MIMVGRLQYYGSYQLVDYKSGAQWSFFGPTVGVEYNWDKSEFSATMGVSAEASIGMAGAEFGGTANFAPRETALGLNAKCGAGIHRAKGRFRLLC